VIHNTLHSLP